MVLQDKYKEIIDVANAAGVSNLQFREQNNVLYIDCAAPSGSAKDKLWTLYNKIDPDFKAGDRIMNITVAQAAGTNAKVVTETSNLNIRQGPGTDKPVIGMAAHN